MSCFTGCSSAAGTLNTLFDLTGRTSSSGTILTELDTTITTCAQAMELLAHRLEKRVCASNMVIKSGSDTQFDLELKVGKTPATVTLKPASGCNYPIAAEYTKGPDSGSGSFQSMDSVLDWLVLHLKN